MRIRIQSSENLSVIKMQTRKTLHVIQIWILTDPHPTIGDPVCYKNTDPDPTIRNHVCYKNPDLDLTIGNHICYKNTDPDPTI